VHAIDMMLYRPKTEFGLPLGVEDGSRFVESRSRDMFAKVAGRVTGEIFLEGPVSGTVLASTGAVLESGRTQEWDSALFLGAKPLRAR
jgi:hypothetical protein